MEMTVTFVGTGGSAPSPSRGLPALLVRAGGVSLLFDCGEGSTRQLQRSSGMIALDAVFISHLDFDHWLGLPGLITTAALHGRVQPLRIYGPPGLAATMRGVGHLNAEISELAANESVRVGALEVSAIPVKHRHGAAYGYSVIEDERLGTFDVVLAQSLGVTPGPDFGRLQRGETVDGVSIHTTPGLMGDARRGRKIVISGDTRPCAAVQTAAHEADLLIHDSSFGEDLRARAAKTGHSTAAEAAEVASAAKVNMLALTHISGRYHGRELRKEARAVFANTETPSDFDVISIPFPERGAPTLVHGPRERY